MLKSKELGKAIEVAIQKKLDNGSVPTKAAIARHFGVKPPALSDWVKKGSISKDKLPEVWRFFSDVAGPEHWGMTDDEWPSGLTDSQALDLEIPSFLQVNQSPTRFNSQLESAKNIKSFRSQPKSDPIIDEVVKLMESINEKGKMMLLGQAKAFVEIYPLNKQAASSQ